MPTEKLSMRKIRDLLRLHHEQKCSNRVIGRSLGISPGTVANYLIRAETAHISWPLPEDLDEDTLYRRLFQPVSQTNENQRPLPDMVKINQEFKRKGVTLLLLWYEYRSNHPDGYGYSRYCDLYRQFTGKMNPSMRFKGKPITRMNNTGWKGARKKAGLEFVRVHDLKHTFGRRLRSVGVSFEDRQDLLGHRSGRITTHYSSAELQNLYAAACKVGENQQSGVVLTLLRNPKNREKKTGQSAKVVSL